MQRGKSTYDNGILTREVITPCLCFQEIIYVLDHALKMIFFEFTSSNFLRRCWCFYQQPL
jgi:hypothetical protein